MQGNTLIAMRMCLPGSHTYPKSSLGKVVECDSEAFEKIYWEASGSNCIHKFVKIGRDHQHCLLKIVVADICYRSLV